MRAASRVLLVDEGELLLLARFTNPDTGVVFWAPVGGGVEPGESAEQAAVREVFEEAGLADVVLGPEVWTRRVRFTWRGVAVDSDERWFLARVGHFEPRTDGWTAEEREDISALRWWSCDELEATEDRLVPLSLAAHYRALLTDGPPPTPVDVGF